MAALQKASVLVESGPEPKFALRLVARPEPAADEVLVQLAVTSVCGSDYALASGELGPTRAILGHEGVGRVVGLGAQVAASGAARLGERVGIAWTRDVCGVCACCATSAHDGETRCLAKLFSGVVADGTFAQFAVAPVRYLVRIPSPRFDSVPDGEVAPMLCGGVTAYKALKTCAAQTGGLYAGQWVAVSGVGGVGLLLVAYARAMGYRVIAVDIVASKEAAAREAGAEHFVNAASSPAPTLLPVPATSETPDAPPVTAESTPFWSAAGDQVKALTTDGLGVAAVLVATSSSRAYQAAFGMLAPFGMLMCVGFTAPTAGVLFNPLAFVANGWRILGTAVGTRADMLDALEFVRRRAVVPLTQTGRLADMQQLVRDVARGAVLGKYVVALGDDDIGEVEVEG